MLTWMVKSRWYLVTLKVARAAEERFGGIWERRVVQKVEENRQMRSRAGYDREKRAARNRESKPADLMSIRGEMERDQREPWDGVVR
jgi:hypothetical protein